MVCATRGVCSFYYGQPGFLVSHTSPFTKDNADICFDPDIREDGLNALKDPWGDGSRSTRLSWT